MKRFCGKARRKNRTEPQKAYTHTHTHTHTHTPVGIVGLGFPGGASSKESACQGRRHKRHG